MRRDEDTMRPDRIAELNELLRASKNQAAPKQAAQTRRRRQSEIAQLWGVEPWQLRRARYLNSTAQFAVLEAEGLGPIAARIRGQGRTR